jgi:hypothetical protein
MIREASDTFMVNMAALAEKARTLSDQSKTSLGQLVSNRIGSEKKKEKMQSQNNNQEDDDELAGIESRISSHTFPLF